MHKRANGPPHHQVCNDFGNPKVRAIHFNFKILILRVWPTLPFSASPASTKACYWLHALGSQWSGQRGRAGQGAAACAGRTKASLRTRVKIV